MSVTDVDGGTASGRYSLTIGPLPAPSLTAISPSTAPAGGLPFTIEAAGSNFASMAQVQWNGTPLQTTVIDATHLSARVPATLLETTRSANVTVSSENVVSNALPFTVAGPAPAGLELVSDWVHVPGAGERRRPSGPFA